MQCCTVNQRDFKTAWETVHFFNMNTNFPAARKKVYCVKYRVPATLDEPLVLDDMRKAMLSIGCANADVSP